MIRSAHRYLRRQFYLYWPRMSRLARITAYFAGLDLLLLLLWSASLLIRHGGSPSLAGWAKFLAYVTAVLLAALALRWLRRKVMWRLRNRLIVTYVFIGVIPVILLLCIGTITAYLFAWQFATYVVTTDIRNEVATLGALNERLAVRIAEHVSQGASLNEAVTRETGSRFPHRELTVWLNGKSATVPASAPPAPPPPGKERETRAVAIDGNRLVLRVADSVPTTKGSDLVVVASVPFNARLLERFGAGLGQMSLSLFSTKPPDQKTQRSGIQIGTARQQKGTQFAIGDEQLNTDSEHAPDAPASLKAGTLPPAVNRFDREITGASLLQVLDWKSGSSHTALLAVVTRPSRLYDRLFRTVGQTANVIIAVLVVIVILFGVIELLAIIIGIRLTRTMTRSVAALYGATQHINRGEFDQRIEIKSQDQLAALEGSFNSMTASLQRLMQEQKEKQRLENELVIAQEVQAQLFPRQTAEIPELELHGICRPARTVSGDYYDFLPLAEAGKVALAAGDVSGKGISAALLMATIHSAVRAYVLEESEVPAQAVHRAGAPGTALAYANGGLSPAAVMTLLNRQLYHSTPMEKYATLFFSTYDTRSGALSYCNAGHLAPLVLGTDGEIRRLEVGGTVVGLFDGMHYEETQVSLSPGDIFVAYSDGITEPENDFGEFGEQRLIDLVRESRTLPLARISELVMSAVLDWIGGAEQPDDMTLVLARPR